MSLQLPGQEMHHNVLSSGPGVRSRQKFILGEEVLRRGVFGER